MGGISRSDLTGPHHHTASAEQRCGPTIGYRGLYSRSWESRTRCGVKLDAIPNAHDHIAMYKEWAWTSLLISCANNRFVRWEFMTGAPARSHLFDAGRRLVREPF